MQPEQMHKKLLRGHGVDAGAPTASTTPFHFGRMFTAAHCPPQTDSDSGLSGLSAAAIGAMLNELGRANGPMDEGTLSPPVSNNTIPTGYTFLGQFIDHDITFDPFSRLRALLDNPAALQNIRTPGLDLDSVYGYGPEVSPFLYQQTAGNGAKMLIGSASTLKPAKAIFADLPRNHENVALIGDPRNDENLVISQLHLAFLHFHNAMVDALHGTVAEEARFDVAREHVVWHYHKLLIDDFLPRTIGAQMTADLLDQGGAKGPHFFAPSRSAESYMPLEFSGAAYRYGHSQVRGLYKYNNHKHGPLFQFGASTLSKPQTYVEWRYFFDILATHTPIMGRKIDTKLPAVLFNLPFFAATDSSLASRNLMRGQTYGLPSGQTIANLLVDEGLMDANQIVAPPADVTALGFAETPLWYYVLHEAQTLHDGHHLGPVGGRIVGEVLLGLMRLNPHSCLNVTTPSHVNWTVDGKFSMPLMLHKAYPQPALDPIEYRVQPGDTLGRIAEKFSSAELSVRVGDIMQLNPTIQNPNEIYAGQQILIPNGAMNVIWPLAPSA